jgi:hypothetical protein
MKNCYLLIVLIACSCSPAYVPNLRNAPMFTKGGEFQGSVQMLNGVDLHTAVSVSNHIAFMANGSLGSRGDYNEKQNYHRHKLLEGGAGYYVNRGRWGFQLFAGYGKGEAEGMMEIFTSGDAPTIAKFDRYFIQPAFGFYRKSITMAVVGRVSVLDFYQYQDQSTSLRYDKRSVGFFEPAFIFQYYFDHNFFITSQVGLAGSMRGDLDERIEHRFLTIGTGLGVRLGGIRELVTDK